MDTGWFKSSRSSGGSDNCVEVRLPARAVSVRDSKEAGGPVLAFSSMSWAVLLDAAKAGRLDVPR
ncbi:DUF397 domain-containing protein [Saccharopolyspora sp. NFXS83]|uniref:DUF397 domain-containing protein n=1 Tax=Saccharopolyspora sp. NFXS83 TaxID=2993560 RepID=UPI00224AFA31|nr:DUF397 domain-containing protein [Saccharopolyspora sp. NFXS83]MCX2731673.1 DUF397 domain-containing protein [Saccharopolyspora sp. NFXS83]